MLPTSTLTVVVLLLLPLLASVNASGLRNSGCDMEHVPTFTSFDPQRYEGLWYPMYDFAMSPYLLSVRSLIYENTYNGQEPGPVDGSLEDIVTSKVTMVFKDDSCSEHSIEYQVSAGVLSRSTVSSSDGTVRQDVMRVLYTDYESELLFLYEVYENGQKNEDNSNLSLMFRDHQHQPQMGAALISTLTQFCGPRAASFDFFQALPLNFSIPCQHY